MFNYGKMYKWESVHKKFKPKFAVTLLGKTDAQNEEATINGWGSIDKLLPDKIGYVTEIPKGGEFTFEVQLPGCAHIGFRDLQGWGKTREEAISNARREYQARVDFVKSLEDPLTALNYELEHFDFNYSHADDYRYWASGNAAQKRIEELCKKLGLDVAEQLSIFLSNVMSQQLDNAQQGPLTMQDDPAAHRHHRRVG